MAGVSATLEFDAQAAFDAVDQIDAAFAAVAQDFGVQLAQAVEAVAGTPIEPEVDAAAVTDGVDAALAAVDSVVVVDADAAAVTGEVDAAVAGADSTVTVDADVSAAEQSVAGIADTEPVVVPVEADVADAVVGVEQVGQAASTSSTEVAGLTGATSALGVAASGAGGSTRGLSAAVGSTGGTIAATAGAAAVFGSALTGLYSIGVRSAAAQQTFNAVLGRSAEAVNSIDVGGLNTDIAGLAQATGSGAAGTRNAAAALFQLGESSGTARPQVEQATEQILALAANAVATRPTLGQLGDVVGPLGNALARGGRAAARFGFDLQASEIQAEAVRLGLAETDGTVSQYARTVAGASLASQQLGDSIGENVSNAGDNATIALRQVQRELDSLRAAAGRRLIEPVNEVLQAAVPIAGVFADTLSSLAVGVLPLVGGALAAISPPLQLLATALGAIPAPVLTGVAAFFALQAVLPLIGAGLDALAVGAYNAVGALAALDVAAAANPVTLLAAGLAVAVTAFVAFRGASGSAGAAADADRKRLQDLADTLTEAVGPSIDTYTDAIKSAADETPALDDALRNAGLSASDFADIVSGGLGGVGPTMAQVFAQINTLASGGAGAFEDIQGPLVQFAEDLNAAAEESLNLAVAQGQVPQEIADAAIEMNTAEGAGTNYAAALARARAETDAYVVATGQAVDSSGQIVAAFGLSGQAAEEFGQDTIDGMQSALTAITDLNDNGAIGLQEFVDSIGLNALAISGFVTNVEAIANRGFPQLAAALFQLGPQYATAAAQAGGMSDATLRSFEAIISGAITMKDLTAGQAQALRAELTTALGADVAGPLLDNLGTIAPGATTAGNNAASALGGSASALDAAGQEAGAAGAGGVEQGLAAVQSAAASAGSTAATGFGDSLGAVSALAGGAMILAGAAILINAPFGVASSVGTAVGSLFGASLSTAAGAGARAAMAVAAGGIVGAAPYGLASSTGSLIGSLIGGGIASGIRSSIDSIASAAAQAVNEAEAAARAAADSHSPSRVFMAVGSDIGEGLAVGIASQTAAVGSASAQLVDAMVSGARASLTAAGGLTIAGSGTASSSGGSGSGGAVFGPGSIVVTVTGPVTSSELREVERATQTGVQAALERRRLRASLRAGRS